MSLSDLPAHALRRVEHDRLAWLATVTADGVPFPTPVWFAPGDGDLVVFVAPGSRKLANIRRNPLVTLHFETDDDDEDVVVITGEARVADDISPDTHPGYLGKYRERMARVSGSLEAFASTFSQGIRIQPRRAWIQGG